MKKVSLAILISLGAVAGAAHAQSDNNGVMMSTDPAKAADVEQRAQALQSQQQATSSMAPMHSMKHHKPMHHGKKAAKAAAASGASM